MRAKPGASRSRLIGWRDSELEVALAAPPVDGAANGELVRVLAKALGLRRSAVCLKSGQRSRHKTVAICGCAPAALTDRIAGALASVRQGHSSGELP